MEPPVSRKRKLTADERTIKNRERNKSHARKTRERKKFHMMAFAARIKEMEEEATDLRSRVDARYTASVLLGLGGSTCSSDGNSTEVLNSTMVCGRPPVSMMGQDGVFAKALEDNHLNDTARRVRRRGKYTPQEREIIRRERNRIHAKKTRDKKKVFLEASETMIRKLEDDVYALRDYLVKCNLLSTEELQNMLEKDRRAQIELASVKDPVREGSNALVNLSSWGIDESDSGAMDTAMMSQRARAGNSMMQTLFNEVGNQELGATDDEADEDEENGGGAEMKLISQSVSPIQEETMTTYRRSERRAGVSTRGQPTLSSSSSSSSISDLTSTATTSSSYSDTQGNTSATMSGATSTSALSITSSHTLGRPIEKRDEWTSTWSVGGEAVDGP